MSKVEEMLRDKKLEIDELQVPEELGTRLGNALQNRAPAKRRRGRWEIKIAAFIIAFVLLSYNADTLAIYGKELLGFEGVMNGTLKELNKMGMGQTVEKSYTFSNGVKVTLNGVMIDDNNLTAFYTVENPGGNVEDLQFGSCYMKGAVEIIHQSSGRGMASEDKSSIKWIGEFEPPNAFEKHLTWMFDITKDGKKEEGSINFELDRNKAMGHALKDRLNRTVKVGENEIRLNTIIASPTSTVVKGTVQDVVELAISQMNGVRILSPSVGLILLADGKEVSPQGWGASSDMKGVRFEVRYDALPKELKKLQLHLVSFRAEHEVNELVKLELDDAGRTIQVKGQDITINKVEEVKGETFISITTEDSVILSRVYLMADGKRVELTETIEGQRDKKEDGTITHTRTLRFKAIGKDLKLEIKRMKFEQACDEYIDIPID